MSYAKVTYRGRYDVPNPDDDRQPVPGQVPFAPGETRVIQDSDATRAGYGNDGKEFAAAFVAHFNANRREDYWLFDCVDISDDDAKAFLDAAEKKADGPATVPDAAKATIGDLSVTAPMEAALQKQAEAEKAAKPRQPQTAHTAETKE